MAWPCPDWRGGLPFSPPPLTSARRRQRGAEEPRSRSAGVTSRHGGGRASPAPRPGRLPLLSTLSNESTAAASAQALLPGLTVSHLPGVRRLCGVTGGGGLQPPGGIAQGLGSVSGGISRALHLGKGSPRAAEGVGKGRKAFTEWLEVRRRDLIGLLERRPLLRVDYGTCTFWGVRLLGVVVSLFVVVSMIDNVEIIRKIRRGNKN